MKKLIEIEPVLKEIVNCIKNSPRPAFNDINYTRAEVLEAMESLLSIVSNKTQIQRKKVMQPDNHCKPWSEEDDKRLKQMFINQFEPNNEDIFYIKAIEEFQRTRSSIRNRLQGMGFITYPYRAKHAANMIEMLRNERSR